MLGLAGANDLALASDRSVAVRRAIGWAENEIQRWTHAPSAQVSGSLARHADSDMAVRVEIVATRPSVFGRILPPGGWTFGVEAVAVAVGRTPLCIIATQRSGDKVINLKDAGRIRAPACMIHSNRDVTVENSARVEAGAVQAVSRISGGVHPAGASGAQPIADPFQNLPLTPPSCTHTSVIEISSGSRTLNPGVYCADITISGNAQVRLRAGEFWFVNSHLLVKEDARLEGDDAVLLFGNSSTFKFDDRALVRLSGRRSGLLAGFVMASVRSNTQDFIITSENVESLLGVIYVPNGRLIIDGRAQVARESAWTVIVAQSIELKGNPTLFVNANYSASNVPVPDGVGPTRSGTRLVD